jgi:hypothetical protein
MTDDDMWKSSYSNAKIPAIYRVALSDVVMAQAAIAHFTP